MNNIKNTLRMGLVVAAGAAAMYSCTDTWNDHYDVLSDTAYGTTMQALEANASDFAEIVKLVGYDRELGSDNVYTIWAPANGSFNVDSIKALASKDKKRVIEKFINNHVARYATPLGLSNKEVTLLNEKNVLLSADGVFGQSKITKGNLSCANGVLHVIDGINPYYNNLFETIEDHYNAETDSVSLYSFLSVWDADSLDEERSVSRGVDADGNKIWVDSVVFRNNTVLKNVDALLYEEDSSYIALIPSAEAYAERVAYARTLLNFNPAENIKAENACDSLQDYYANMFALTDLFYNKNANEHAADSLKSTNYKNRTWPYNLYYTVEPRQMHPDKQVNDILAKCGTPIEASNGDAYLINEYPMDVTEQFFKKLSYRTMPNIVNTDASGSTGIYTNNMTYNSAGSGTFTLSGWSHLTDQDSVYIKKEMPYFFVEYVSTGAANGKVAFELSNTLSGTYDIYVVTCPYVLKAMLNNTSGTISMKDLKSAPYRFYVDIWQREENGEYKSSKRLTVPEQGSEGSGSDFSPTLKFDEYDFPNIVDTLYVGRQTFTHSYYSRDDEGVMLQITPHVTAKQLTDGTYNRNMLISGIILRPVVNADEEQPEGPAAVRKQAEALPIKTKILTVKNN